MIRTSCSPASKHSLSLRECLELTCLAPTHRLTALRHQQTDSLPILYIIQSTNLSSTNTPRPSHQTNSVCYWHCHYCCYRILPLPLLLCLIQSLSSFTANLLLFFLRKREKHQEKKEGKGKRTSKRVAGVTRSTPPDC